MDRRATSKSLTFAWRRGKIASVPRAFNIEYYGNPSEMALRTFNHVFAIGKSHCPPQYNFKRPRGAIGYLIHYVNRGQYWHRIDGQEFRVSEGGICLLDKSTPFEQGNDQPQRTDLWWISFNGPEVPRIVAQMDVDHNPVFERVPRQRFELLFRQLWTLTLRRPVAHEAQCHAILAAILAELFVERSRQTQLARKLGSEPTLSKLMQAAMDYIQQRSSVQIGLKDMAAAVGLNLYHFARRFRREVGMAPIQYLNRIRIEQAKQLLTGTGKPIAEVGDLVGISDPGYFARIFRKNTGSSPQTYRQDRAQRK